MILKNCQKYVEQEFFRIAQEALNNALKHAAASSVTVFLRQANGKTQMEIVDDGMWVLIPMRCQTAEEWD